MGIYRASETGAGKEMEKVTDKEKVRQAKNRMAIYYRRKEAGLCVGCGKDPPVEGYTLCEKCREIERKKNHSEDHRAYAREYQRALRKMWREKGYCTRCGKQDALTIAGRRCCFDCLEKIRERYKTSSEADKKAANEKHAKTDKARREERAKAGLCPGCGKVPQPGYKYCAHCRALIRKRGKKVYDKAHPNRPFDGKVPRTEWPLYGACCICAKPLDGAMTVRGTPSLMCKSCYENSVKAAAKGREAQGREFKNAIFCYTWLKRINGGRQSESKEADGNKIP